MAMKIILEECLQCGACVMVCPKEAITEETDSSGEMVYRILTDKCTECVGKRRSAVQGRVSGSRMHR